MGASIDVVEADLADETQVARLFEILDAYARGPGGQNAPLSDRARENLGPGLREHPMAFVLFGRIGGEIVGVAVCVWGFSTFAGRPSVNLHDFSVLPEAQGRGVGTAILEALERRARDRDAAKLPSRWWARTKAPDASTSGSALRTANPPPIS